MPKVAAGWCPPAAGSPIGERDDSDDVGEVCGPHTGWKEGLGSWRPACRRPRPRRLSAGILVGRARGHGT